MRKLKLFYGESIYFFNVFFNSFKELKYARGFIPFGAPAGIVPFLLLDVFFLKNTFLIQVYG